MSTAQRLREEQANYNSIAAKGKTMAEQQEIDSAHIKGLEETNAQLDAIDYSKPANKPIE